jgi:hypothetical protein
VRVRAHRQIAHVQLPLPLVVRGTGGQRAARREAELLHELGGHLVRVRVGARVRVRVS